MVSWIRSKSPISLFSAKPKRNQISSGEIKGFDKIQILQEIKCSGFTRLFWNVKIFTIFHIILISKHDYFVRFWWSECHRKWGRMHLTRMKLKAPLNKTFSPNLQPSYKKYVVSNGSNFHPNHQMRSLFLFPQVIFWKI